MGGPPKIVRPTADPNYKESILKIDLKTVVPLGYQGMATIHVQVQDAEIVPVETRADPPPNAMLLLDLRWQSGAAGGEYTTDGTRGAVLTVGGTDTIELDARLVSSVQGEDVVAYATKRVEATVSWYTSGTKDGMDALPMLDLAAPEPPATTVTSDWFPIPLGARSMIALSDTPTGFPTLVAEFATNNDAGGTAIKYRTLNPNANGTPIVLGVEFVRFVSTVAMRISPVFELWA
jgi:hypothetical protein